MNPVLRIPRLLYCEAIQDLSRPHPIADERIGFFFAKSGNGGPDAPLLLFHRYRAVPDEQYLDDPKSGARIGSAAIRGTMQELLDHRESAFHVHLHAHPGKTGLSPMDLRELPQLIRALQSANPLAPHGIIVFSLDNGCAFVWLPGQQKETAARIVVVGAPLAIWEGGNK
jgi:hypothetical protein